MKTKKYLPLNSRFLRTAIYTVIAGLISNAILLSYDFTMQHAAAQNTLADTAFLTEDIFPSCNLTVNGPYGTGTIRSLYITMRDSVRIAVDVVMPDPIPEGGKIPTILMMTRHWRSEEGQPAGPRERLWTSHGYALVTGDVRGTGASFGEWRHHRADAEIKDFFEVIDWIIQQPWSDGRVVGVGSSYSANTADWMAAQNHPALVAVVSRFPEFDPYADLYFPGGVPNKYMAWEMSRKVKEMDLNIKKQYESGPRGVRPVDADSAGVLLQKAIELRRNVPAVREGLEAVVFRDDRPSVWQGSSLDEWGTHNRIGEMEEWGGPIQSWASWTDGGTAKGVLHRFMTFDNPQLVFIGAFNHSGFMDTDPYRPIDTRAQPPFVQQWVESLCFVKQMLDSEAASRKDRQVVYYTMGEGRWKTTTEWPPANSRPNHLYLSSDNKLAPDPPKGNESDQYVVDYTATTGTRNRWATQNTLGDVVYSNREIADKKLLTYTTDPLPQDMEISGHPLMKLHVTSTENDGAFFVYLESVAPDGTVRYLTEGMLRGLHRRISKEAAYEMVGPYHSFKRADVMFMIPGEITTLEFELMPLSVLVPAGDRLRIAIAGADADTFQRIPEKGTPQWQVHRSNRYPSHIIIPIIPTSEK